MAQETVKEEEPKEEGEIQDLSKKEDLIVKDEGIIDD